MTTLQDRWTRNPNDLVITPTESDEARAAAFVEPFGVAASGGIAFDRAGHPLSISPAWTVGLDRYAAAELKRVARAIADPAEIRLLWKIALDGSKIYTRRYLATVEGVAVAADINRAGWSFATEEDPGFDLDALKVGELSWSAAN